MDKSAYPSFVLLLGRDDSCGVCAGSHVTSQTYPECYVCRYKCSTVPYWYRPHRPLYGRWRVLHNVHAYLVPGTVRTQRRQFWRTVFAFFYPMTRRSFLFFFKLPCCTGQSFYTHAHRAGFLHKTAGGTAAC